MRVDEETYFMRRFMGSRRRTQCAGLAFRLRGASIGGLDYTGQADPARVRPLRARIRSRRVERLPDRADERRSKVRSRFARWHDSQTDLMRLDLTPGRPGRVAVHAFCRSTRQARPSAAGSSRRLRPAADGDRERWLRRSRITASTSQATRCGPPTSCSVRRSRWTWRRGSRGACCATSS